MAFFLVTGAGGFIGTRLVAQLLASGHRVMRVLRRASPPVPGAQDTVLGDMDARTEWATALDAIDVVVHLAARVHVMREQASDPLAAFRAVNVEATRALAQAAAKAGVTRFVFLSSAGIYGLNESDVALDEAAAAAPHTPYAQSKWEAEQMLRTLPGCERLAVTILRPPIVYGAGDRGNMLRLVRLVARGIPLPFAAVRNRRSMVCVGNLVSAIAAAALQPAAAGRTYVVRDGVDLSTPELVRAIGGCFTPPRGRMFPLPTGWLRAAGHAIGRPETMASLLGSLCLDDRAIRTELGWRPPYGHPDGLREEVAWFLAGGEEPAAS